MASGERRKCKGCHKLFRPDPRNRYHQRYCSAPNCRVASKAASQARWLAAPENHDYFRGPVNVARVRAWRSRHPGYWRNGRRARVALQGLSLAQAVDSTDKTVKIVRSPLQEIILAQPAVLIGLIAHIVGTPLQDDILRTTDRLLRLGQDILGTSAAQTAMSAPDGGAGRDRLRDLLQDPRLSPSPGFDDCADRPAAWASPAHGRDVVGACALHTATQPATSKQA